MHEEHAKEILKQVAAGMDAIHKMKIFHRDMKPDNVFVEGGIYQIGDFGFASKGDTQKTTVGTPYYMAPEILSAKPEYTKAVDMWSIGVMYYQMIYGRPPYKAAGNPFELKKILDKFRVKFP